MTRPNRLMIPVFVAFATVVLVTTNMAWQPNAGGVVLLIVHAAALGEHRLVVPTQCCFVLAKG